MMNLNQTELDVIRDVVRAAVADAIKSLRDEIKSDFDKSYTREVIDLKLQAQQAQIDELSQSLDKTKNILASLWETAFGKAIVVANGFLILYALWQILPH